MDELVAAVKPEQRFELVRVPAAQPLGIETRIRRQAARDLLAVRAAHDQRIAALEPPDNLRHSGRQQALATTERSGRAFVHV